MCILIGGLIGCAFGLIAGYLGGLDRPAHYARCRSVPGRLPSVLLALIFAVTIGPSFWASCDDPRLS